MESDITLNSYPFHTDRLWLIIIIIIIMEQYINLYDHLCYSYIDLPEHWNGFKVD